jgi:hypothetical protein
MVRIGTDDPRSSHSHAIRAGGLDPPGRRPTCTRTRVGGAHTRAIGHERRGIEVELQSCSVDVALRTERLPSSSAGYWH